MSSAPSPSSLNTAVIREAARWLVRLHSGDAGPDDYAAFQRWRQASPERELAWQRAEHLSQQFGAVPPEVGVPVLTRQTGVNRRAVMKTLAVLGMTVPMAWLSYRYAPLFQDAGDYRTAVGENREVMLADGSRVHLNTATDIDVRYSENARLLKLRRGEIYVQTAPDTGGLARPFLIDTVHGRLRALGTRFIVRQLSDNDDTMTLAVLEHRVEVTLQTEDSRRVVDAGEEIRFTANTLKAFQPIRQPAGTPASKAPSWTRGALEADNMRLDAFLAELARYRRGLIRCDPVVGHLRISGVFRLDNTDHVLAVVRETLPIHIVRHTRYWVTVTAKTS